MSSARFKSMFTDAQLLDAAIEVIESMVANGVGKSQRRFDAHRAEIGIAGLPRADSICARLGISWEKLCQMPGRTASGRAVALGKRDRGDANSDWVTNGQISFALRLAANRRNAATINAADYRREREMLLREGCAVKVMPDEAPILQKLGTWRAALAVAELQIDNALERDLERLVVVNSVIDRAVELHEVVPTQLELLAFAKANYLTLPDRIDPYPAVIEQWRSRRIDQGLVAPPYEPRRSGRPDFTTRVIWERPQRVRRGYWTEERAIAAVARFLESRAPGQPTTRKAYVDWSKGDRDAPSATHIDRWFGGFARIRRLASAALW